MIINLISFLRQLAYAELKVRVIYTKLLFNVPYDYSNILRATVSKATKLIVKPSVKTPC